MKILFVNLPFSGHVYPTLGLAQELVKKGHEVTYLLTSEWEDKVLATGASFIAYKDHKLLSINIREAYDTAINLGHYYDGLVYEQFFFLGKQVAEKLDIPVVRLFATFATNKEILDMYKKAGGVIKIIGSKFIGRRWTKRIARGINLKTDHWLDETIHNPAKLNLVYTTRDFQIFADEFPDSNYKFVGASIYQREDKCDIPFETIKQPLIYISLGTIVNKDIRFYKKCFSAFANMDVAVLMAVGNNSKDRLGKIPDNFHIYPFVPQLKVLEKASVFITHGDANSVNEAIHFATPMVVIPKITDQPANARQVEKMGLGINLAKQKITSEKLREATISLLDNKLIADNLSLFQRKSIESGGNARGAKIIEEYFGQA